MLWLLIRTYESYMYKRKTKHVTEQMHANQERANDDMQEQLESQDELIRAMYRHNIATLGLVSDYITIQGELTLSGAEREETAHSIERVRSLTLLEDCVFFEGNALSADLKKYTEILFSELLPNASVPQESNLIPAELASPIAVQMYELIKNALEHAFEKESPANYVQVDFNLCSDPDGDEAFYKLSVMDSGVGIPAIIDIHRPETAGFTLLNAIASKQSATIEIARDNGTKISIRIPIESTH
jgi:two-component sensor histidine kinase